MSLALPMGSSLRKWSLCVQMAWRWTLRSEHRVPVCSGLHRKLKFVRSCNSYHSHDSWSVGPRGARVNPFGEGIDGSECGTGILPQYRSYQCPRVLPRRNNWGLVTQFDLEWVRETRPLPWKATRTNGLWSCWKFARTLLAVGCQ